METMTGNEKNAQVEQPSKPSDASRTESPPPALSKRFWQHPWFILGAVVFAVSFTVTLMNNTDMMINLIVASVQIKLPLLILGCAFLGAAIEFLIVLGPRKDCRAENLRLKKQIRELMP
jgi:uncharacterized integral membrane protein